MGDVPRAVGTQRSNHVVATPASPQVHVGRSSVMQPTRIPVFTAFGRVTSDVEAISEAVSRLLQRHAVAGHVRHVAVLFDQQVQHVRQEVMEAVVAQAEVGTLERGGGWVLEEKSALKAGRVARVAMVDDGWSRLIISA